MLSFYIERKKQIVTGSEDIIEVDPRQALTKEWWFLYENKMICKNGKYDW